MAYAVQYQFSFYEPYTPAGLTPHRYRVSFLRDGFTGEPTEVTAGDNPVEVGFEDNSDNAYISLLPSKATFALYVQDYWQGQGFYVESDREVQALIEIDTTGVGNAYQVDWVGWVLPQDLKEAYMYKPYPMSVSAACGLSTLKTRPLLDASGSRLIGLVAMSTVIRTALGLTGTGSPVITGVNLFELADIAVGQTDGSGFAQKARDPLNRTKHYSDALVTDKSEALNGYDTLKRELEPFGCRMAMVAGNWMIVRADEAPGKWNVWDNTDTLMTRRYAPTGFTSGPVSGGEAAIDLNVWVGPSHPNTVLAGGTTWLENIKPGVRAEQSFGKYRGDLPNGNFADLDGSGFPAHWVRKNISDNSKATRYGTGTEEDPYRMRIYGSDYEGYIEGETQGVYQQLDWETGSLQIDRNKKLTRTLKGRFRLYNARGAKIVIRAASATGVWWILADGGTWVKNPKASERVGILVLHDVLANHVDRAKPGWCPFSIKMPPIDYNPAEGVGINGLNIMLCKPYTLELYDSDGHVLGPVTTPEPYIEYADIELIDEDETLKLEGTQRTIVQKNKTAETVLSLSLGDVPDAAVPALRTGTLFKNQSGDVPTTKWYRPDANILAVTPTGKDVGRPLIDWAVEAYARQEMHAALTFEGTIFGRLPYGIHSVLRFVGVGYTDTNGDFQAYAFRITRLRSRRRIMEHELSAVRIMTDTALPTGSGYTDLREWQTPDGPITIATDSDGTTPGPSAPTVLSDHDKLVAELVGLGLVKPTLKAKPSVPGFVPITPGDAHLRGTVFSHGIAIGSIKAALRKQTPFSPPL